MVLIYFDLLLGHTQWKKALKLYSEK